MTDPFYVPNRRASARKPQSGELLWTLRHAPHTYRAELRDHGAIGAELQLLRDSELVLGRHFDARALAIAEADALRVLLEQQGWMPA